MKKARGDARIAAIDAMNKHGDVNKFWGSAAIKARFYFRLKRRRDHDGLIGSLKAAIDGFTDAGLWFDDSAVTWLVPEVFIDKLNPRVEIEVLETKGTGT